MRRTALSMALATVLSWSCAARSRSDASAEGMSESAAVLAAVAEGVWGGVTRHPACLRIDGRPSSRRLQRELRRRGVKYTGACAVDGTVVTLEGFKWNDRDTAEVMWWRLGPLDVGVQCQQRVRRYGNTWRLDEGCVFGGIVN
jgi:hypothetical protein